MVGKIFINYRRGDDPGFAGRLFDRLEDAFKPDQLFMDVDSIPPGQDFVQVLTDQVSKCDVLLAVIGQGWIDARNEKGARRLDDPNDFVRIEIEAGLKQDKLVIPVLVNGAEMPRAEALPTTMQPFSRRNAVRLTHDRFRADTQGLIDQLKQVIAAAENVAREADRVAREQAEKEARALVLDKQRIQALQRAARDGISLDEVRKVEELTNWDFIKASKNSQDYYDHVARYPGGPTERLARRQIEKIAWEAISPSTDHSLLRDFLVQFPTGEFAQEATRRLQEIERKIAEEKRVLERAEKEEAEWKTACVVNSAYGYENFRSEYPLSKYALEASQRLVWVQKKEEAESLALKAALIRAPIFGLIAGTGARVVANLMWAAGSITEQSVEPIYIGVGILVAVLTFVLTIYFGSKIAPDGPRANDG